MFVTAAAVDADPVVSTAAFMSDHMLGVEYASCGVMEPGTQGLSWNMPRDTTTLYDGHGFDVPMKVLNGEDYPCQWTEDGPRPMADQWKSLWKSTCEGFNALAQGGRGGLALPYLYSRLGNDCGRIIRLMHDDRVSWGTYQVTSICELPLRS